MGPVFTLQVAHRHLTFLAAPAAYDAAFFRGGDAISFEKGVMQYTYNVRLIYFFLSPFEADGSAEVLPLTVCVSITG